MLLDRSIGIEATDLCPLSFSLVRPRADLVEFSMAIQKEFDLPDLSEEDMAGLVR